MQENEIELGIDEAGILDTEGDEPRISVYEIGYHLLPTLSEDAVQKAASELMEWLKGKGATFVGDRSPSRIELAYPIAKRVNSKRTSYDEAYFGWVAFELNRDVIAELKTTLDGNQNVLRYIILSTTKDAVAASLTGDMPVVVAPTGSIEKPKRESETGGELSEVALDEALQTIATEDAKTE